VHGLLSNRASFEPFDARILGRKGGNIVIGKHSGIAALNHILSAYGVHLSDIAMKTLLGNVQKYAESAGGSVSHVQVVDMARKFTTHIEGASTCCQNHS
jgi:homocitrate synthase NifV